MPGGSAFALLLFKYFPKIVPTAFARAKCSSPPEMKTATGFDAGQPIGPVIQHSQLQEIFRGDFDGLPNTGETAERWREAWERISLLNDEDRGSFRVSKNAESYNEVQERVSSCLE